MTKTMTDVNHTKPFSVIIKQQKITQPTWPFLGGMTWESIHNNNNNNNSSHHLLRAYHYAFYAVCLKGWECGCHNHMSAWVVLQA